MKIDDYEISLDRKFIRQVSKNIYLSDEQIDILNKYNIDYHKYNDIKMLIYAIEEVLNYCYYDDLDFVSREISEFDYYHNINK